MLAQGVPRLQSECPLGGGVVAGGYLGRPLAARHGIHRLHIQEMGAPQCAQNSLGAALLRVLLLGAKWEGPCRE